ncbi:hypothetical protein ONZ45_g5680 [Pleurotus djamor]|nr:hypothetical protein ONZ45_g5680 [Pleurotus djamor]
MSGQASSNEHNALGNDATLSNALHVAGFSDNTSTSMATNNVSSSAVPVDFEVEMDIADTAMDTTGDDALAQEGISTLAAAAPEDSQRQLPSPPHTETQQSQPLAEVQHTLPASSSSPEQQQLRVADSDNRPSISGFSRFPYRTSHDPLSPPPQFPDDDDDDDSAMPGLEPLEPLSYHPSPTVTPHNEGSRSGASTPQRNNRRPRVEDDHDAERDRRHPSERTGNAHYLSFLNARNANGLLLFLSTRSPQLRLNSAPRLGAEPPPFGGVPFNLFGHQHNMNLPQRSSSTPAEHSNAAPPSAAPNVSGQEFTFHAGAPNGLAITFDLLRGGPPIVRQVDENFRIHTHGGLPPQLNPFTHPTTTTPPAQEGSIPPSTSGTRGNGDADTPASNPNPNPGSGAAQSNNRARYMTAEDLLAQIRNMTNILTNALGSLEAMGDNSEMGKKIIRGLEEVPEGLAKRMEAVAKASGEGNGFGSCAICFDSLLEDSGFSVEAGPTPAGDTLHSHSHSHSEPATQEGTGDIPHVPASGEASIEPTEQAETASEEPKDEAPLPKIVTLPCSHAFHSSCLIPWFSKPMQTTCPSCRFNIDPEGLIWGLGGRYPGLTGGLGGATMGGATAFGPFTFAPFELFPPLGGANANAEGAAEGEGNQGEARAPGEDAGVPPAGIPFNFNGMGIPLLFSNSRRAGGNQPQRRAQSVPRGRTQSLPTAPAGQPGATSDDMNIDGPTWTRVTDRPNLPQLPPGAHRTVYHTHLPMGGVDVILDVIPVNMPSNGTADPTMAGLFSGRPLNPTASDFLNMIHERNGAATDNQGATGHQPAPAPSSVPASDNTNTTGQTQAPQQPAQAQDQPPAAGVMGGGFGFLQNLLAPLMPNQTAPRRPPVNIRRPATTASATPTVPIPQAVPQTSQAGTPPAAARPTTQPQVASGSQDDNPMFERIVARALGPVFDYVLAGMPGGTNAAHGDTPAEAGPMTLEPLPQPRPQTVEQAAATGLPSGLPAQLASNAPLAPAPTTNPVTPGTVSQAEFEQVMRDLEPAFGPVPPEHMEAMRRDYEQFVANNGLHHHHLHHHHDHDHDHVHDHNHAHTHDHDHDHPPLTMPGFPALETLINADIFDLSPTVRDILTRAGIATGTAGATGAPGAATGAEGQAEGQQGLPGLFQGTRRRRRRPQPPTESKPWSPPPAPGTTLRQRVEKMEREAGFRCDDVSCGAGPSDEDPTVSEAVKSMKQLSIRHPADHQPGEDVGKSVCAEEQVHGSEVEVTCPVCRHTGCITKEEWAAGSTDDISI